MIHIDHIMLVTDNIEKTAQRMRERYGLACFQGGLHADGTRTWVIPLGSKYVQYIEILTIEDPILAGKDFFGRWLLERVKEGEALVGWALQTDELDNICRRLNLKPWTGSVTRPDGSSSSWTEAGFEQVATSGWLPFFISYNDLDARRKRAQADLLRVHHSIEPIEISWIELGGNQEQLHDWLGNCTLPVRVTGDTPGVYAIGIKTSQSEVILS
jgi:hypothetical protein